MGLGVGNDENIIYSDMKFSKKTSKVVARKTAQLVKVLDRSNELQWFPTA